MCFGVPRGSFAWHRGRPSSPWSIPPTCRACSRQIDRSLQSGEEYCVIFRFRHASGEWRWMEGRGLPALR